MKASALLEHSTKKIRIARFSDGAVLLGLTLTVAAALALRVVPSYSRVFTPTGVHFQEPDAYFHVRTVQNLVTHFPHRSGFDPYLLFPGGESITTGPMWDWMLGSLAWICAWIGGSRAPSPELVDVVGAWTPAVLGALFTLPVFWLGRRLFGTAAGLFAALWVAVNPGGFLWITHLGLADHHAAESFFALLVLAFLIAAVEGSTPRAARWMTALAGLSLGAYLDTRPAGVFVVGILMAAALIHPVRELARALLGSLVIAALVFLGAGGGAWADFTWLALAGGIGVLLAILALDHVWAARAWPRRMFPVALAAAILATATVVVLVRPHLIASLGFQVQRMAGLGNAGGVVETVQELRPLLRSENLSGWLTLNYQLGTVWTLAIPALVWVVAQAIRARRPALTLFVVWSAVMTVAAFLQVRMIAYYGVSATLLAGVACAWITRFGRPALRIAAGITVAALIPMTNLSLALNQLQTDTSPPTDWQRALAWLRRNSPEPMGDPAAYFRHYPRLAEAERFKYPASAYGITAWWDYGYWIQSLARRIPSANGTQAGVEPTARFFTAIDAAAARKSLEDLGAHYVLVDPALLVLDARWPTKFLAMLRWAGRDPDQYFRIVYERQKGEVVPVLVLLPDYFRSMAARLYLFNARAAEPTQGVWIFATRNENNVWMVSWRRRFDSYVEAESFQHNHAGQGLLLGSIDPLDTCVPVEEAVGLREVFSSDPSPLGRHAPASAVKGFEVIW